MSAVNRSNRVSRVTGAVLLAAALGIPASAQAAAPFRASNAISPFVDHPVATQTAPSPPSVRLEPVGTLSNSPMLSSPSLDLAAAGSWLVGQQVASGAQAGALPWTPGGAVYSNTQGATALGLLRLYRLTSDTTLLNAAVANGQCQINDCISGFAYPGNGTHHFATHDPLFLIELSQFSGDPQYAQFVTDNFWTPLVNGTYGDTGDNYNAITYTAAVVSGRASQGIPELAAWDLSKLVVAAHEAGQTAAEAAFMQGVLDSLNAADASHTTYDVIGLTGAIWASAVSGIELDPTTGTWASAGSTADLGNSLLLYQTPGGGFVGSTTITG